SRQGISVIDLNGFGQGCGNPTYDQQRPILKGNTNFPNNPNVVIQGSLLIPPLTPGSCTFDGGSEGIFTLAKDSSLNDLVATFPSLESAGDMMLGHSLDNTFNNSQPFGCQTGGGNICAATGLKQAVVISGGASTVVPQTATSGVFTIKAESGVENLTSWAPHPNPPPLVFPPLCESPLIGGIEPTSVDSILFNAAFNLLTPGSKPLGIPEFNVAPDGLIASEQNNFFQGPSPQQTSIIPCQFYSMRQQIGHFLYVVDRTAREVVVMNSNRFTVIDRVRLPDPTSLAISPNIDVLAVTNQGANQVSFIDINPASATFHQLIQTTIVGNGPIGIAWTPDNEDILVCNQRENTVSVLSAFDFRVRKVLRNQLRGPFEVAITPRQNAIGFQRGVYFAYILNGDGSVAIFESGPGGINGFGFDDIVASLPFTFNRPKTLQPDQNATNSQFWVLHEDPLEPSGQPTGRSGGAATLCGMASATFGQISLDVNGFQNPRL
ncbi:MAG: beta-propeller fold lactonase family protein, partial [Acidobacteriota bacterium]|nr:beta-propeller fold lactonase family protein [Acidobacteriota bacterium]